MGKSGFSTGFFWVFPIYMYMCSAIHDISKGDPLGLTVSILMLIVIYIFIRRDLRVIKAKRLDLSIVQAENEQLRDQLLRTKEALRVVKND